MHASKGLFNARKVPRSFGGATSGTSAETADVLAHLMGSATAKLRILLMRLRGAFENNSLHSNRRAVLPRLSGVRGHAGLGNRACVFS